MKNKANRNPETKINNLDFLMRDETQRIVFISLDYKQADEVGYMVGRKEVNKYLLHNKIKNKYILFSRSLKVNTKNCIFKILNYSLTKRDNRTVNLGSKQETDTEVADNVLALKFLKQEHPLTAPFTLQYHPSPFNTTLHPLTPPFTLQHHPSPFNTNLYPSLAPFILLNPHPKS